MEMGFCTWAEVTAWDGQWGREDVALLLPVALEREAARKRLTFEATVAAIGSLFSKDGAKPFLDGLSKVTDLVRAEQLRLRGAGAPDPKAAQRAAAAQAVVKGFASIPLRKGRRR